MYSEKPKECYKALLAEKLVSELGKRNMDGFYCATKEDLRAKKCNRGSRAEQGHARLRCGCTAGKNLCGTNDHVDMEAGLRFF